MPVDVDHAEDSDVRVLASRAAARLLPTGARWQIERVLDTDVHVVDAGDGTGGMPVVLLHHWFGNVHTWRHVIAGLSATNPVLAFDRPGFGWSERRGEDPAWPSRYGRAHAAAILAELLDARGYDRAVLVGCSAGGTAALEFIDRFPERVAGVALISPAVTGDLGPPGWLRPLARHGVGRRLATRIIRDRRREVTVERLSSSWGDPGRADADDVAAYDLAFAGDGWADALWARMIADPTPDLRHVFGAIRVPSLFVAGTADRVIRPSWTRKAAAATPNSTWLPLPGLGHTPQEESPATLLPHLHSLIATT